VTMPHKAYAQIGPRSPAMNFTAFFWRTLLRRHEWTYPVH
jgi:hypothetical protein